MTRLAGIQIGESTHHHDQLIVPISLSVMNTMVNRPVKPIPDDDFESAIGRTIAGTHGDASK